MSFTLLSPLLALLHVFFWARIFFRLQCYVELLMRDVERQIAQPSLHSKPQSSLFTARVNFTAQSQHRPVHSLRTSLRVPVIVGILVGNGF